MCKTRFTLEGPRESSGRDLQGWVGATGLGGRLVPCSAKSKAIASGCIPRRAGEDRSQSSPAARPSESGLAAPRQWRRRRRRPRPAPRGQPRRRPPVLLQPRQQRRPAPPVARHAQQRARARGGTEGGVVVRWGDLAHGRGHLRRMRAGGLVGRPGGRPGPHVSDDAPTEDLSHRGTEEDPELRCGAVRANGDTGPDGSRGAALYG